MCTYQSTVYWHISQGLPSAWSQWHSSAFLERLEECGSLNFLTPDALHVWHKFIFDHALKWIINIMGGAELDQRMATLEPHVGVHYWQNSILKLKQVTG
jgi:hypothetical protein